MWWERCRRRVDATRGHVRIGPRGASSSARRALLAAKGASSPVSAIAGTPSGGGYWITTQNGTVETFGDATGSAHCPPSAFTQPSRSSAPSPPPARVGTGCSGRTGGSSPSVTPPSTGRCRDSAWRSAASWARCRRRGSGARPNRPLPAGHRGRLLRPNDCKSAALTPSRPGPGSMAGPSSPAEMRRYELGGAGADRPELHFSSHGAGIGTRAAHLYVAAARPIPSPPRRTGCTPLPGLARPENGRGRAPRARPLRRSTTGPPTCAILVLTPRGEGGGGSAPHETNQKCRHPQRYDYPVAP
jgi:hypothetical protein